MTRRTMISCMMILIVTGFALAAGRTEAPAPAPVEAQEFSWRQFEGEEITILLRHGGHTTAIAEGLIPYFEEDTGVKVEIVWMGRDGWVQRLYSMMSSKTPDIDVIVVHDTDIVFLASGGFLEPMDAYLANSLKTPPESDIDLIPQDVRGGVSLDGNLYAIPTFGNPYVMYYRKDVYQALGLSPAETWDDYIANSRRATQSLNSASPVPYGHILQGRAGQHLWEEFLARAWPRGGGLVDRETGEIIIQNAANRAALQQMVDEVNMGIVPPEYAVTTFADFPDQFSGGVVSAGIASAAVASFLAADMDVELIGSAPLPGIRQPDGSILRASPMSAGGLVINSSSRKKDAAWLLLAYQLSRPDLIEIQAGIVTVPVPDVYLQPGAAERIRYDAAAVGEQFKTARLYDPVIGMNQALQELATQISEALTGRITVERALANAEQAMRRHLEM